MAVSVIIFLAVDFFYTTLEERLWTGYKAKAETPVSPESSSPRTPKPAEYKVIMERNVFGASEEEVEEKEEEPEPLEPTKLNVALLGTVVGDPERSVAVIRDGAKKSQDFYRVGDAIQGAVVKRIRRGEVILRAGEKDEILKMEDVTSPRTKTGSGTAAAPHPPGAETTITVSREEVRQRLQNINELFTQARIRPYFVDGKPDGLAITNVKDDSIFSRMGLRNGDVVKGMNGRPIKAPNDALALFRKLRSGDSFSLELSRRGAPETISYRFE